MATNPFYVRNGLSVAGILTVDSTTGDLSTSGALNGNTASISSGAFVANSTGIKTTGTVWVGTNSNVALTPTQVVLGNSTVNTVISYASANSITINGLTLGYMEAPINSQSASYTSVLSDTGKTLYHPDTDNNARTFTIANNSAVPYPLGTVLTFINAANVLTIAINNDTLNLLGYSSNTGSRTLTAYGMATAVKVTATKWVISGINLT